MNIFGLLDSTKKISRADFEKALRNIPELSEKERAYIEGVFQDSLRDGLTKDELRRHNPNDPLDSFEIEKIKKKLTGSL